MRTTLAALMLFAASAHAERAAAVADHPASGRLIVELATQTRVNIRQHGNRVDINLSGDAQLEPPDPLPRNVVAFAGGDQAATLTVVPGARVKWVKQKSSLVIDILDPAPATRHAARPEPAPAPAIMAPALSAPAVPVVQPSPSPEPASAAALPAAVPLPSIAQEPVRTEATAAPPPAAPAPAGFGPIRIAAGPQVGAASFRRGGLGVVVFDEEVGPAPGDGDKLGPALLQHTGRATVITVPIADGESLALDRETSGWVIKVGAPGAAPVAQTAVADGIAFPFAQPGRTMTIRDPVTDQLLLLGTTRAAGGNALIATGRSAPGYVLLPTWLGLAIELTSDAVDLRASQSGFTLDIPDPGSSGKVASAVRDNEFGIPNAPASVLLPQLHAQFGRAAGAPLRGRGKERVAAARTMLALGMAAEAQALLSLAADDDPAVASDPTVVALSGVAAVLAGRPAEAGGLDNPALPTNDETALWRGLRDGAQGSPAPALASAVPLLPSYPDAIRRRIAPPVIEAAVAAGDAVSPADLDGPLLTFARALQKQKAGDVEAALQGYDAIEASRDERDSVRAAAAAAELRLATGRITPAVAADRIERQTLRWRGDLQEASMRLRVAELRTQAGQWRAALESLRDTEALYPTTKSRAAALKTGVIRALLAAKDAAVSPLDLVTIAGDFGDCIPDGPDGERMAGLLAEKLAALDLPSRAIPVLQGLMDGASSPPARAEFALRLAQLQLDAGEPVKAEAVLQSVDAGALEPARAERRALLLARARAGRGDPAGAAALLARSETPAADEFRAALLAKSGDWRGSLTALEALTQKTIPEQGGLTEQQQDLILRQAAAAVQAGDPEALRRVKRYESRMAPPRADLFRVLTAASVDSPEDLPRAARELAMSRSLPGRLDALKLR